MMNSVVVSIFATTTLLAATVTVEKPAGDGANTITQEIDLETGDIVSERMTCVYVVPKADAETLKELRDSVKADADATAAAQPKVSVYRLELHSDSSGETAWIVGQDGVKRPVVVVSPDEYKLLTERLDLVWAYFNSSRDGRVKLHGKVVNTVIDSTSLEKVETHSDGYTHREKIPPKVDRPRVVTPQKKGVGSSPPRPSGISDRQFEMRKRLEERKKNPVKTVTLEHDAATGKDRVVE